MEQTEQPVSDLDPEWVEFLASKGLRVTTRGKSFGENLATGGRRFKRWIGRTDSRHADLTFQARAYSDGSDQFGDLQTTHWKSPDFEDPITAYVYAELNNWGQPDASSKPQARSGSTTGNRGDSTGSRRTTQR